MITVWCKSARAYGYRKRCPPVHSGGKGRSLCILTDWTPHFVNAPADKKHDSKQHCYDKDRQFPTLAYHK